VLNADSASKATRRRTITRLEIVIFEFAFIFEGSCNFEVHV